MRKYLRFFYRFLKLIYKINWIKTLYINLKFLPINKAIYFPIVCYGKIKIKFKTGRIEINDSPKFGLIQIGVNIDSMPCSNLPVMISIENKIIFNGRCLISGGAVLESIGKGIISLGDHTRICSGAFIKSFDSILIGNKTWITAECIVMDSNIHYLKDTVTGKVEKANGKIVIGDYCWIVMRSVLTKGTILPNYSVVGRNSFVAKDYSKYGEGIFIVGSPAIIKKKNIHYIPSLKAELKINDYFKNNDGKEAFFLEQGFELFNDGDDFKDFDIKLF